MINFPNPFFAFIVGGSTLATALATRSNGRGHRKSRRMFRQHVCGHTFSIGGNIIALRTDHFKLNQVTRTHVAINVTLLRTAVIAMWASKRFYVRVPRTNMTVKVGLLRTTILAIFASVRFIASMGTHVACHVRRMVRLVLTDLADKTNTFYLCQRLGGLGIRINNTSDSIGDDR